MTSPPHRMVEQDNHSPQRLNPRAEYEGVFLLGDIYRPTVRMDDTFQRYMDKAFHASTLDRNQVFRLMLFCAPFSAMFAGKLRDHLKAGADAPAPCWTRKDTGLYLQQTIDYVPDVGEGRHDGVIVRIG